MQQTEMARLKESEPDITHKERCVSRFCVLTPWLIAIRKDSNWLQKIGRRRRKTLKQQPDSTSRPDPWCHSFVVYLVDSWHLHPFALYLT